MSYKVTLLDHSSDSANEDYKVLVGVEHWYQGPFMMTFTLADGEEIFYRGAFLMKEERER